MTSMIMCYAARPGWLEMEAVVQNQPRPVVMVLGMHRSGTSALAGALIAAGGRAPANEMPKSATNREGYHEPMSLYQRHKAMMGDAGVHWMDWRPGQIFDTAPAEAEREGALLDFNVEFGDAGVAVFKDPRLCRLFGFWDAALRQSGMETCPVLIHRHPMEVAQSLSYRNDLETSLSLLLWLSYVLDIERATRGRTRVFVSYPQLLTNPAAQLDRIKSTFGFADMVPGHYNVDASLQSQKVGKDIELPPPVAAVYDILSQWAANGETAADHSQLDRIMDALIDLSQIITENGPLAPQIVMHTLSSVCGSFQRTEAVPNMVKTDLKYLVQAYESIIVRLRSRLDMADGIYNTTRSTVDRLTQEVATLTNMWKAEGALAAEFQRREENAEARIARQLDQLAELRDRLQQSQDQILDIEVRSKAERTAVEEKLLNQETALSQANKTIADLELRIDETTSILNSITTSRTWRATYPLRWSLNRLRGK